MNVYIYGCLTYILYNVYDNPYSFSVPIIDTCNYFKSNLANASNVNLGESPDEDFTLYGLDSDIYILY